MIQFKVGDKMELEEIQKNEQTTNSDFTDQNKNVKRKIKKIRVIAILSVLILITILWYSRFIAAIFIMEEQ